MANIKQRDFDELFGFYRVNLDYKMLSYKTKKLNIKRIHKDLYNSKRKIKQVTRTMLEFKDLYDSSILTQLKSKHNELIKYYNLHTNSRDSLRLEIKNRLTLFDKLKKHSKLHDPISGNIRLSVRSK